ncbi:16085_t:CDS:10 [Funneliformis geosporum]|uniref:16085_t:CDS:1 n=1 Tax=Funneliformis geosporum TaxID=1117311 RepID=A0A9W4WIJ0_9GLOM|nr:16085_t:CDS:10 [Funneliformis geosporum]
MSGRAFRKAINKEYELSAVQNKEYDSEEIEPTPPPPKRNLFDLLNEGVDDVESHVSDENQNLQNTSTPNPVPELDKKTRTGKRVEDMSNTELETLIREITKQDDDKSKGHQSSVVLNNPFLIIDTRLLDADGEMRRMFSSGVVDREIRSRNYARTIKRTLLAKPRQSWPPILKFGLRMELLKEEEGICYFKFVHSQQYQIVQLDFLQRIATHDPNAIFSLLHENPYHIDSLLQMSDIYKMSGDHTMAGELIERALYAFEKSFHVKFNITKGTSRMDYKHFENRAFFLGLLRQIQSSSRRGCWQTSFEFSKLLLSLDPLNDPLSVLYFIDYLGLKAQQHSYVLSLANEWTLHNLQNWPNFVYSAAIANFQLELRDENNSTHEMSTKMLEKAILYFPSVILLLSEKCDIQLENDVAESSLIQEVSNYLNLLINHYVEQVSSLWTQPEVIISSLNDEEFSQALLYGKNLRENSFNEQIPLNLSRYIVVSENSKFLAYLPEVTSGDINLHDPLPPPDGVSPYDAYSETSSTLANSDWENLLAVDLRQLLGNTNMQMIAERIHQIADSANLQAAAERLIDVLRGTSGYDIDENQQLPNENLELPMPGGFPRDNSSQTQDLDAGYLCCGKPELSVMLHGKIEEKDFEIRLRNKLKSHIIKPACWLRSYELESPLEITMRMLFISLVINVS